MSLFSYIVHIYSLSIGDVLGRDSIFSNQLVIIGASAAAAVVIAVLAVTRWKHSRRAALRKRKVSPLEVRATTTTQLSCPFKKNYSGAKYT